MRAFTQFIQGLFNENQAQYPDGGQAAIRDLRRKAMDLFLQKELPDKHLQGWQQSVLNKKVKTDYIQSCNPTRTVRWRSISNAACRICTPQYYRSAMVGIFLRSRKLLLTNRA